MTVTARQSICSSPPILPVAQWASRAATLLDDLFASARALPADRERSFVIGGKMVRVLAPAGSSPVDVTAALRHLEHFDPRPPTLEILVLGQQYAPELRSQLTPLPSTPGSSFVHYDGISALLEQTPELSSLQLLAGDGRALIWHETPRSPWITDCDASPFRNILSWHFATAGLTLVHAAAVGTRDGALLIGGRSGAGKSSTAAAVLDGGGSYLGDDSVLLGEERPGGEILGFTVHSLYCSLRLCAGDQRHFAFLAGCRSPFPASPAGKTSLLLFPRLRSQLPRSAPLRAVVVPRIGDGRGPALEPLSPAAALRALAPNSLLRIPGEGARSLAALSRLVQTLPCFHLQLGGPRHEIGTVLLQLLERSGRAGAR